MKPVLAIVGVIVVGVLIWLGVTLIDVDQTQEAELPDVDIDVEGGQAPEFDASVGSIETGTTEVTVPTLEVNTPEEEAAEEAAEPETNN